MKKYLIGLFLSGWSMVAFLPVHAQLVKDDYYGREIPTRPFDDADWDTATAGIDYSPPSAKDDKDSEAEDNAAAGNPNARSNGNNERNYDNWWGGDEEDGFWSFLFKLLLIISGIALITALAYRLSGGQLQAQGDKRTPSGPVGVVDIREVERHLQKSDMELLIDKALEEGDYMSAVRLHYLWAIKELSARQLIKWKRDKTNRDYIRELRNHPLKKDFREATRIFERIWYGNQTELGRSEYLSIQKRLFEFIQSVKRS